VIVEISYSKSFSPSSAKTDLKDERLLSIAFRSLKLFSRYYSRSIDFKNPISEKVFGFYSPELWGTWSSGLKSSLLFHDFYDAKEPIQIVLDAHAFCKPFRFIRVTIRTSFGHFGSVRIGRKKLYKITLQAPLLLRSRRLIVGDFSKLHTSYNYSLISGIPVVSIVLLNKDKAHLSRLAAVACASSGVSVPFEILCADNGSSQESIAELREGVVPMRILEFEENLGFGPANNRVVQEARGEYLLFVNNDAFLDEGSVDEMIRAFHEMPDCRIAGSVLRYPDSTMQEAGASIQPDGFPIRHGRDDPKLKTRSLRRFHPVDYVSGACLMIKKKHFLEMGGFAEKYSPAYYEDTDLCMRSLLYGQKVYLASRANCYHIENATTATIEQGAWATRTAEAHREIFLKDWGAYLNSRDPKDLPWHLRETKQVTTDGTN
jgi:GT2 family glycosyltransferase